VLTHATSSDASTPPSGAGLVAVPVRQTFWDFAKLARLQWFGTGSEA